MRKKVSDKEIVDHLAKKGWVAFGDSLMVPFCKDTQENRDKGFRVAIRSIIISERGAKK